MEKTGKKMHPRTKLNMILTIAAMLVLAVIVAVKSHQLSQQLDTYTAQKDELQQQIDDEKDRADEIEEYRKYTQTDAYIEKEAREKLGLVKKNEIVFKNEDN